MERSAGLSRVLSGAGQDQSAQWLLSPGMNPRARLSLRDVEAEVADLPVPDDVVLALEAELALGAQVGEGSVHGDEVVVAVDLGTDESAGDVGVDCVRGVLRSRALGDRPGSRLVLAQRGAWDQSQPGIPHA